MAAMTDKSKSNVRRLAARSEAREAAQTGRILSVRVGARLSQSELASAIGVTPTTISRWERALRLPRGEAAERLAFLLRSLEAADVSTKSESPASRAQGSRDHYDGESR